MKNKLLREANAVVTIAMRQITLFLKSPARLVQSLVMPVVFLGMFGGQLSQNMGMNMGYDFNTFMLVGMLVQTMFMVMGNGVVSLVEDRMTDFTQEILVSPVSRYSLILGTITGSAFAAYITFFFTIGVGYGIGARLSLPQFFTLLAFSPLMCLAAGSLAVVCIGFIQKAATASLVVMMLAMTQTFLSGALIPVNHSAGLLAIVSRILPMTFCVDFMRGVFYAGVAEGSGVTLHAPLFNLVIIVVFTALFLVAGTAGFVRAEKNR
ncbi:MAG: ABC transporter permease [Spirochaetaceae bacterium]|jgi:ABC-2 type transport system permease protein|nr:ABC transporter permease [Spirochaetaceae bacterium]